MNVQHLLGFDQGSLGASLTRYFSMFTGAGSNTTEAQAQVTLGSGGTVTLPGVYVSANDHTSDSELRVRKNTANGNGLVTITANTANTQFEDTTNSDVFADDDEAGYRLVTGGGGTAIQLETAWHTWAPSSGTVAIVGPNAGAVTLSGSADAYWGLGRPGPAGITTEAQAQNVTAGAGTFSNGFAYVSGNGRTDAIDIRSRKDSVAGNIIMAYAASATGAVEDVTGVDSVADGSEVGWSFDQNGGTGTLNLRTTKLECTLTDAYPLFATSSGTSQGSGLTHYHPVSGYNHAGETTEADSAAKSNGAFAWSDLYVYVSAFSLSGGGAYTVRSRLNASFGNMVVSFTATGQQADTSNTDTVADEDDLAFSAVTGGTGGSVTPRTFSTLATAISSVPELSWSPVSRVAAGRGPQVVASGFTPPVRID